MDQARRTRRVRREWTDSMAFPPSRPRYKHKCNLSATATLLDQIRARSRLEQPAPHDWDLQSLAILMHEESSTFSLQGARARARGIMKRKDRAIEVLKTDSDRRQESWHPHWVADSGRTARRAGDRAGAPHLAEPNLEGEEVLSSIQRHRPVWTTSRTGTQTAWSIRWDPRRRQRQSLGMQAKPLSQTMTETCLGRKRSTQYSSIGWLPENAASYYLVCCTSANDLFCFV